MKIGNYKESLTLFGNRNLFLLLCLSSSLILGLIVRLPYFFTYNFALNDGALFVQMSNAIRENNYILPATVLYNKTEIPFAYPPLSFYLIACFTDLFDLNVLDVIRYMPLFFNILCLCVFTLLAARLIKHKAILLYTCLFFPLIPRSYEWLIMGGGVTRSVGFFFTLLAIYQADRFLTKKNYQTFICCSLPLSMALLSHLEWGITSLLTVSLLILYNSPQISKLTSYQVRPTNPIRLLYKQLHQRGFILIVSLGTAIMIMTSPWWATVVFRHGLTPFMAASKTSEWEPHTIASITSALKIFDDGLGGIPLSALAIIGWLISLARKDWFLPVWLVAIFLTTPRHGATPAAMPLAILASIGLVQFVIPTLLWAATFIRDIFQPGRAAQSKNTNSTFRVVAVGVITVIFVLFMNKNYYVQHTPLIAITSNERSGMAWIKEHTPSDAKFIVLTDSVSWQDDRVAEWFPVLANRKSLTTAQGLEWLPGGAFHSEVKRIVELKNKQALGGRKLAGQIESDYDSFQYVAIFIPHAEPSYGEFLETGHYRVVYAQDSVLVFEKT